MSGARVTTFPKDSPTEKQVRKFNAAAFRAASARARAEEQAQPRDQAPFPSWNPKPKKVRPYTGQRPAQVSAGLSNRRVNGSQNLGVAQSQLEDAFTRQDEAILMYLDGVCNPWTEEPVRAPLVVGGFALETDTFQMIYEGEAVAGLDGVAYVGCSVSGWVEGSANNGVPVEQFESYSGGTQGNIIFASLNPAANVIGFPPQNTASGTQHGGVLARQVEAAWDAYTRVRVTSVGLEIFSDAAVLNATGKVLICSSIRPADSITPSNGALANNQFGQIVTAPRKLCERAEMPLAGWKSGEVLRAFAVPAEPACFNMNEMPAAASLTSGFFVIGAIAQGMVAGQKFAWRAVYNYESVAGVTNKTNVPNPATIHAGLDRLTGAIPHLRPHSAVGGPVSAIERLPVAVNALGNEMVQWRPTHAKNLMAVAKAPQTQNPGFWGGVRDGVKMVLGKAADTGFLSKIPLVGGIADMAAKGLNAVWNMF